MPSPLKPWEQQRTNVQHQQMMNLNSSAPTMQMMQTPVGRMRSSGGLPQLPPRPGVSSYGSIPYSYAGGSYPSRYNSYSYGSYGGGLGGYGSYGGLGGYGMGGMGGMYGGMYGSGYGMGAESRFIQLAEESTRPAFQGIESLVRAFGSISMMLDSTFFAVTSSFRAVLGVAENFGQIRSMFGQIWSSFALLRFVNWIYRRILRLFGVNIVEDLGKEAWSQAINETGAGVALTPNNTSSWPIFMFLGMIVSAPYFISRLLPPIIDKSNPKHWPEPGRRAIAQYPFQASNAQELSLRPGEEILIAPKSVQDEMQLSGTGWILAASRPNSFGLVPVNYLQAASARPKPTTKTSNTHNLKYNDISAATTASSTAASGTNSTTKSILNKNVTFAPANDPYAEFASVDPFTGSIELAESHSDVSSLNCAQNSNSVPVSSQTNQTNSSELPK